MGMTLKEMLRKGASEGTVNADEVRALAQECGLDTESLYTILEERGIKIQENETALDVDSILAEVESAEAAPTTITTSRRRTAWRRTLPT